MNITGNKIGCEEIFEHIRNKFSKFKFEYVYTNKKYNAAYNNE